MGAFKEWVTILGSVAVMCGLVLAATAIPGCGGAFDQDSRQDKFVEGMRQIEATYARWQDANRLANSTSRIALSGPVTSMQNQRQAMAAIPATGCLADVQRGYVQYMSEIESAYLAFMGNDEKKSQSLMTGAASTLIVTRSSKSRCESENSKAQR